MFYERREVRNELVNCLPLEGLLQEVSSTSIYLNKDNHEEPVSV
jgi:hypothetical protein